MQKELHPESYRTVIFRDINANVSWLGKSCAKTRDTDTFEDGKEYPLIKLEISSESHPFFTGKMQYVDTAGRIDKFNKKFGKSRFAKKIEEAEAEAEATTSEEA
ncbi:type B 50S ribosomal protein L31 [Neolewinella litorea]|uniref:Large ribosomal subunit protein bL31B n=1 Tax=Neolewinella litorea TaxID=2562452 RepID=A0A4S4NYN7_9BACT|nr:type B 50S ribosomal protein L31 [Neolewinella litorea]THH41380.1 type B 50S ribosomal protein L31 [Neolewinella litorea]